MEFEDNTKGLFSEPNAYVQKYEQPCDNKKKKVVFQEPYDRLPTFYMDNGFKKGNCDCIPKPKPKDECNSPFSLDIKNILPLLSNLLGGSGSGISNILSSLGSNGINISSLLNSNKSETSQNSNGNNGGLNLSNLLSSFTNNGAGLNGIVDIFKNIFGNKTSVKKSAKIMQSSDISIKDYKRIG